MRRVSCCCCVSRDRFAEDVNARVRLENDGQPTSLTRRGQFASGQPVPVSTQKYGTSVATPLRPRHLLSLRRSAVRTLIARTVQTARLPRFLPVVSEWGTGYGRRGAVWNSEEVGSGILSRPRGVSESVEQLMKACRFEHEAGESSINL